MSEDNVEMNVQAAVKVESSSIVEQQLENVTLLLHIQSVECGAFDDQDRFCVGWKKQAKTKASFLCFDLPPIPPPQQGSDRFRHEYRYQQSDEEQHLTIRLDHDLIRMKLMQISNLFVTESFDKMYILLKFTPSFLRDSIPKDKQSSDWLTNQKFDFTRFYDYFDRVCWFEENEEKQFARFGLVYRVHLGNQKPEIVNEFFSRTQGKVQYTCLVDEKEDCKENMFDDESFLNVLKLMSFEVAYQAHSLISLHKLLPMDIIHLSKDILELEKKMECMKVAQILRQIRAFPINRGPHCRLDDLPTTSLMQIKEYLCKFTGQEPELTTFFKQGQCYVHTALLSPSCGVRLEGPNHDQGNRILRQFPNQTNNFLRVRFIEEDFSMLSIRNDVRVDCQAMLNECFGKALKERGIMIGARTFYFLACSNSGMRELTFWFFHPFQNDGKEFITPYTIRASIGDLSQIRNPAKYAARMGQAFTTSMNCLEVKREWITLENDICTRDEKYEFSDGIGMISENVGKLIMASIEKYKGPIRPIQAFQIRLAGAKGMLVVNSTLEGYKIVLRKSMVKFPLSSNETFTMEIPNFYPSSLPMHFNRQMISLLGSLGVSGMTFLNIQQTAIEALEKASSDHNHAANVYKNNGLGRAVNVKGLMNLLSTQSELNPIQHIPFLRDANNSSIDYALRRIKYHARISVPDCVTLVGVLDEFGLLFPFEIIACIFDEQDQEPRYLYGKCLIGRNPMLAPGDVQMVKAVYPPKDHPLSTLRNVVIFSQKGSRPLPNMLAGGDLDGDIFNIFQHKPILDEIQYDCEPSNYESNKSLEFQLSRPCMIDDCTDFFLDFIRLHQLGQIANRHLQLSDQAPKGALDECCIRLAQMHSIAVDFCKSGIANEFGEMPKLLKRQKPDFMQKEGYTEDKSSQQYYQSNKPLGLMFRSIDIFAQTNEWQKKNELKSTYQEREKQRQWKRIVWDCLIQKDRVKNWQRSVDEMHSIARLYATTFQSIAQAHSGSTDKLDKLKEEEVFMGHILVKPSSVGGGPRLKPFDASAALQDDFEDLCKRIRLSVLFRKDLKETDRHTFDILWRWLTNELDVKITDGDVREQVLKHLEVSGLKGENPITIILNRWKEELLFAIRQGCAWFDATVDKVEYGKSAPWIIVPCILKAHQCLDCIDRLTSE